MLDSAIRSLDLRIPEIGTDYHSLIESYLTLANSPDLANEDVIQAVLDMIGYASDYAAREEALMQKVGYPNFKKHRMDHEIMQRVLGEAVTPLLFGNRPGEEVVAFMEYFFIEHMTTQDAAFVAFLRTLNRAAS
jgi:hemerythrin-like metal-binding protein